MVSRLALYHPPGRIGLGANPFGKDVANIQLFRALAAHGGFEQLDVVGHSSFTPADFAQDLHQGVASSTGIGAADLFDQARIAQSGVLLRGQPYLDPLAWLRRGAVGDRAYSLVGLSHTLAPPAVRELIAAAVLGPVQPWDAVICTSPAVQAALTTMFEEWCDHLAARFGGKGRPMPQLPLIPLGVDRERFAAQADRPDVRAAIRAELGLAEADILVLWVGRLSFFEKAFPQPMLKAVEQAARATGAKVHFAMAGWFPDEKMQKPTYQEAAAAYAPTIGVSFPNGNDPETVGRLWAGADIFISLVDNIQETIGITPLEAMASGLPVVASDWDGYRYTVRDGIEGFLIPSFGAPANVLGQRMIDRHALGVDTYQFYVGAVAQHTAIHIGRCTEALTALIRSPELRARMGAAGRDRVRTFLDWPVVVARYQALFDELAGIRASAEEVPGARRNPVKVDPFEAFAGFATQILRPDTPLSLSPGAGPADIQRAMTVRLDAFAGNWRANPAECTRVLELIASGEATTAGAVSSHFPAGRRAHVALGVAWMCKLGILDWL
jgi:D-inositol-3-phosphate glycosyltransferase